mmetsp:Transcript_15113/g.42020  ORF Transcript_15113/g.42020 Transcript_15113/m.42020 type:complete len:231 (-) Transcript_15113:961-1653(-)
MEQGSNLPLMLTHRALHPNATKHTGKPSQKHHVPVSDRFVNLARYLCSEAFSMIDHTSTFSYLGTLAMPSTAIQNGSTLQKSNWTLTIEQRQLLLWHNRLGHINFGHVQRLLAKAQVNKTRMIQPSNNKSSHCPTPLCEACQYAKQKRVTPPSRQTQSIAANEGKSSLVIVHSGQSVSVDLYQCSARGRLPETYGKDKDSIQYTCGALFVDHATRLVHHAHQCTTTASEI